MCDGQRELFNWVLMASKTYPTARNISVVDAGASPPAANSHFVRDAADWSVTTLYPNQTAGGYPCLATSTYDATLVLTLNQTVGFVLIGSDDWAQGLSTVAVYPKAS